VPYKIFKNRQVVDSLSVGNIKPVHVQYIPTNRCNLHCSFCSCENRDRGQEMGATEAVEMCSRLSALGCQAVTITGGGEPLLHPDIGAIIIDGFMANGIEVGLVTNGTLFDRQDFLGELTWCRISCSDERELDFGTIQESVTGYPDVGWALSYVLSENPDVDNLRKHVGFAQKNNMTHVRVVADLLGADSVPMDKVKKLVGSPLVVWQDRKDHTAGVPACLLSLMKPVIGPDGSVYPCCGVQYATEPPSLDLTDSMVMGNWRNMPLPPFPGGMCVRCYYGEYNHALAAMVGHIEHVAFV
jgi:organic radical activating enzyme